MCTRYYIEKNPITEHIGNLAKSSKLLDKNIGWIAKPMTIAGEIRPDMMVPVIASDRKCRSTVFPMIWGYRLNDTTPLLVNARVETAKVKDTFMDSWMGHRCIVPCSYYFEWEHVLRPDGRKVATQKYAFQPREKDMCWLCGLYRIEKGFPHFVVITRPASAEMAVIHDRMPLMLPEPLLKEWINPKTTPSRLLSEAVTDVVFEKAQ